MIKTYFNLVSTSLVGSVVYLLLGYLIFDVMLGSYTEAHTTQLIGFKKTTNFSFAWLYASCLAYSFLLTFFLQRSKPKNSINAILYSAIVGVLIACMTDFFWLASSNFYSNLTVVILDIMGAAGSVGITGWLLYLLIQKFKF